MVIVNADDFGLNSQVNRAVVQTFSEGYCSSASIMPNMEGFAEACQLARDSEIAHQVGIHVNLTEGVPLTDGIRSVQRFCSRDGEFERRSGLPLLTLPRHEQECVATEIRAQIAACRKHGIRISHIDSHNHVHNEWAVLSIILPIAREEGIRRIRASRNIGRRPLPLTIYKKLFNSRLRRDQSLRTDLFGSIPEFSAHLPWFMDGNQRQTVELMIHPIAASDGQLFDSVEKCLLDSLIEKIRAVGVLDQRAEA